METLTRPFETFRVELQASLDRSKTQAERNRMGQFATPTGLAHDILTYSLSLLPATEAIRFAEPGFGTGSFYSALLDSLGDHRLDAALGFELDDHYGNEAARLWSGTPLALIQGDFTRVDPPTTEANRVNLLVCNPPYVRHHHIESGDKERLRMATQRAAGMHLSGLAGLYCHFLGLSHPWMQQGAIATWLIPSEFMDVNYGKAVKDYLLRKVTVLRIHRFDPNDVQFADALVSSAIVVLRNEPPPTDHLIEFSYGGSLVNPTHTRQVAASVLAREPKWSRSSCGDERSAESAVSLPPAKLSDFFTVRRGIATGNNKFFILSGREIEAMGLPLEVFRPVLPSPRYLRTEEVFADADGTPILEESLFLLDCELPETAIAERYPTLFAYLERGRSEGVDEAYLCRHRTIWYSQEQRAPTPYLCTYIGRGDAKGGRPFRFILNHSNATVTNVYLLLYPKAPLAQLVAEKPAFRRAVWQALSELQPDSMLQESRVYGGGLHKMEPSELGNVPAAAVADLIERADQFPTEECAAYTSGLETSVRSRRDLRESLQYRLVLEKRREYAVSDACSKI